MNAALANRKLLRLDPIEWATKHIKDYWNQPLYETSIRDWVAECCDRHAAEGWLAPRYLLGLVPEQALRHSVGPKPEETPDGRLPALYTRAVLGWIFNQIEADLIGARRKVLDAAKAGGAPKHPTHSASSLKSLNEGLRTICQGYMDEWNRKWEQSTRELYTSLHPALREDWIGDSKSIVPPAGSASKDQESRPTANKKERGKQYHLEQSRKKQQFQSKIDAAARRFSDCLLDVLRQPGEAHITGISVMQLISESPRMLRDRSTWCIRGLLRQFLAIADQFPDAIVMNSIEWAGKTATEIIDKEAVKGKYPPGFHQQLLSLLRGELDEAILQQPADTDDISTSQKAKTRVQPADAERYNPSESQENSRLSYRGSFGKQTKRGRRRKKRKLTDRERNILDVLKKRELHGMVYCHALELKKIPPSQEWITDGSPITYPEAYRLPKWRHRIQDEKYRLSQFLPKRRTHHYSPTSSTRRARVNF